MGRGLTPGIRVNRIRLPFLFGFEIHILSFCDLTVALLHITPVNCVFISCLGLLQAWPPP